MRSRSHVLEALINVSSIALFALAACSGSVGFSPSPPPPPPLVTTYAALTIVVPNMGPFVRYFYRVSPYTRSIVITIGKAGAHVFATTPGSPGCMREKGATVCTLVVPATPGFDTFEASTYSGAAGSGYELDRARKRVRIVAGITNVVAVTLQPVISNTNDDGPGSMREATAGANPGDTVTYVARIPGTIALHRAIVLERSVTIVGPGSSGLQVSGGGRSEILVVSHGAAATISGMTLTGGAGDDGGAMDVEGSATLDDVGFTHNTARQSGGAIYARGALTIRSCAFSNNVAGGRPGTRDAFGGAVYEAGGSLTIEASRFTANRAEADSSGSSYAYGGAVTSIESVRFERDIFESNAAEGAGAGYGGAVYANGPLTGSGDTFRKNVASAENGSASAGALYAIKAPSITGDTFEANTALGDGSQGYAAGGAVASTDGQFTDVSFSKNVAMGTSAAYGGALQTYGTVSVTKSRFISNRATAGKAQPGYGGAIAMYGGLVLDASVEHNASSTQGGGIWIGSGSKLATVIQNSTIAGNRVVDPVSPGDGGGGICNYGNLRVTASTISGNAVSGGAHGAGGGLITSDALTVVNSTITGNRSGTDGGGIVNLASHDVDVVNATIYQNSARSNGGNVASEGGSAMSLANSIVASGTAAHGLDIFNAGTILSQDYNLVETAIAGNPLSGTTRYDLEADPRLLPLADNGGPTWTNAETLRSPGRAYIPLRVCLQLGVTTDQRGDPRGGAGDDRCDIGAYEFQTANQ